MDPTTARVATANVEMIVLSIIILKIRERERERKEMRNGRKRGNVLEVEKEDRDG